MKRSPILAHVLVTFFFFTMSCLGIAEDVSGIQGKILDASGAAVSRAAVTLTDLTTGRAVHTISLNNGEFNFPGVSPDPQILSIVKSGFENYTERVPAGIHFISASLKVASLSAGVVVLGTVDPEATPVPTRDDVMLIPDTVRVLDRKQLDIAGPVAGGAQMLAASPGANIVGYGNTGATKYTVMLNGVQQGWAGESTGFTGAGSLGITYDGIPVADPATGLWQSATMPQNLIIQDISSTYGPGEAADRGYLDVGGRVEFTPIQPTEEPHLAVALSDGPWGQQNFALVGNTGDFKGWSTVLGGGLSRGDDYLQGPDGFGNHSQSGSVYGKTIKNFRAGSVAWGVFYSKAGGYRPTVIPTTDVGLVEPGSGLHFSEQTSGFYGVLPFADYNKYDRNEMFMTYGRERMNLSPNSSLENTTWFTQIRRFHGRNADALDNGAQVDEWNNPHSEMFGDRAGFTQVLPYNTVQFGGYLISEIYNTRNIFYNPTDGGSGSKQIVGLGSKFRSGYFQQDDVAFYAQDDFHPTPRIHIIPGVRVVGFSTSYSDQAARDFTFAPGTYFAQSANGSATATPYPVYGTHCALYPQGNGEDPYHNIFGTPTSASDGSTAKDQGSQCGAHESRSGVEPDIDASYTPVDWLTIYGGYDVTYRAPSLGGGGGQFQSVDPQYYTLAKGAYSQVGAKIHFPAAPFLRNFIAGADYFHLTYSNQEIDFETALGVEESGGGTSANHGVDAFFDADPRSNIHIMVNFAAEAANYTNYIEGGPSLAECAAQGLSCSSYNNLPVSYVPKVTFNAAVYYGIRHNERVIIEPRFWVSTIGTQYIWSNNTALPTNTTLPAYTTVNLAFNAPIVFHKQSFSLRVDMLNLANKEYNQFAYISSGGYFASLTPQGSTAPSGYINAYPGAPRSIYGTLTYQF